MPESARQRLLSVVLDGLRAGSVDIISGLDRDGVLVHDAEGRTWLIQLVPLDTRPCPTDGWPVFDQTNPLDRRLGELASGAHD